MNYADYYNGGGGGGYQPPQTPYGQNPYQSSGYNPYQGVPGGGGMQGGYQQPNMYLARDTGPGSMLGLPGYQQPRWQKRKKKAGQQGGVMPYDPYGGQYGQYQPAQNPYQQYQNGFGY